MTQRLEMWYLGSLYDHKLIPQICFQYSENNFRFCGKNLNCYKDSHVEKSYFPLKLIFFHEGLFGEYLTVLWFVNESFDNWPTYSYFQFFCLCYIMSLINFERLWAKKHRNLRFYFNYYLLTAVRICLFSPWNCNTPQ